jgi:hypothetical protein
VLQSINREITAAAAEQATLFTEQLTTRMQALGESAQQAAREFRKQAGQSAGEVVPHNIGGSESRRSKRAAETRTQ